MHRYKSRKKKSLKEKRSNCRSLNKVYDTKVKRCRGDRRKIKKVRRKKESSNPLIEKRIRESLVSLVLNFQFIKKDIRKILKQKYNIDKKTYKKKYSKFILTNANDFFKDFEKWSKNWI